MYKLSITIALVVLAIMVNTQVCLFAQNAPNGQAVTLNGMEMYYETYGEGEPLVIIHGFTASSQAWHEFVDKFSGHYKLIIPDMRGHGYSTNPSGEFTHRQSALDIFALLDHLGIDKFKGIGASAGGMALLHMATSQVDRVEAMILVGAAFYAPERAREAVRNISVDNLNEREWKRLRSLHKHGDDQIRMLYEQLSALADNHEDMNLTTPYLSTIKAKTLIIHGDRDHLFPVNIPMEMYEGIPGSYLWILPRGGHFPVGGNRSDMFVQIALEFLGGTWE